MQVVSPFNAIALSTSNTSISIFPTESTLSSLEFLLYNVQSDAFVTTTGVLVDAGNRIGIVASSPSCGPTPYLHVVVKHRSQSAYADPKPFLLRAASLSSKSVDEDWYCNSYTVRSGRKVLVPVENKLHLGLEFQPVQIKRSGGALPSPALPTGVVSAGSLSTVQLAISKVLPDYKFNTAISSNASNSAFTLSDALWPAENLDVAVIVGQPQSPTSLPSSLLKVSSLTVAGYISLLNKANLVNISKPIETAVADLDSARNHVPCRPYALQPLERLHSWLKILGLNSSGSQPDLAKRFQGARNSGKHSDSCQL